VLATVKGDVHDIGKNIVGVVLSCNNWNVIDLGVMVPCEKILAAAREHNAALIGLSGLITPSLEEMTHVAREMEREGFTTPLLIGGATTSRPTRPSRSRRPIRKPPCTCWTPAGPWAWPPRSPATTSVRRSWPRMPSSRTRRAARTARKQERVSLLSIGEARARALRTDWATVDIPTPAFTGVRRVDDVSVADLISWIDWTPFFITWEMGGRYPQILDHPQMGEKARELYADARSCSRRSCPNGGSRPAASTVSSRPKPSATTSW
jgi:5-methyltetrahydrofolate--homocysteine methyltransferase